MNTLSFILPLYNGKKYIARCIKSILMQNYPDLELIIIDDGSTDNPEAFIKKAIKKFNIYNHKVIYKKQENSGVAFTRNAGIMLATGDYITFIDQDDYISQNFCQEFMSVVNRKSYDMVIGGFCRRDSSNKITKKFIPSDEPWAKFCLTYPWARIIRRDFLIENKIKFLKTSIGEDVYFDIIAYSYTNNICMIQNCAYVWFDNPVSVSNTEYTTINKLVNPIYTFDAIMADIPESGCIPTGYLEYYFIKFIIWYLLTNVRNSRYIDMAEMHQKLFSWLRNHFPNYMKNNLIGIFSPKGDVSKNRIAVALYMTLHKLRLDRHLLKLLAKK